MAYTAHPVWGFAPNWNEGILERLEFKTDVHISEIGSEQRVSKRLTPRRSFEASFLINKENRQYFQNMVGKYGASVWMVPLWHQVTMLTAPVPIGASSLPLDTRWREYVAGDYVILRDRSDPQVYEVIQIATVSDSSLTLISNTEKAWSRGHTYVYPCRLARLTEKVDGAKKSDQFFEVKTRFDVRQANPYPSDWTPPATYLGLGVIESRPDDSEDLSFEYGRLLTTLDNELGIPDTYDIGRRPFRKMQYRWSFAGREENHDLRAMLYWLRGRTRAIFLPTFMEDFTLSANAAGNAITVKNVGYTRTLRVDDNWTDIRIELFDGTVTYHRITDAVEVDTATETLTLSAPLEGGFTPAQVRSISYMMPARLDQDSIEINHVTDTDGLTQVVATFSELPAIPVEEDDIVVEWGDLWLTQMYDLDATNHDAPTFAWVLTDDALVFPVYTDTGLSWRYHSVDDFAPLGTITALEDDWDADSEEFVYDPAGYVWICGAYTAYTYKINTTTWSVTSAERTPITISGGPTLTTGYYVPRINPYNNDLYMNDQDSDLVLHRINKSSGTFQPAQTYYASGSNVVLTSPFEGVIDTVAYYSGHTPLYIQMPDTLGLVWVSATVAYLHDFPNSNIFRFDTATGVFTYQFRMVNGAGNFSMHKPLYYDEPTNTLWFWGSNNSWYELFLGEPILTANSLRAWVVGSDPATIVDYPLMWDHQMIQAGTTGNQDFSQLADPTLSVDKYNRGVWIGYNLTGPPVPYESTPAMRFFSFVEKKVTSRMSDGDTPTMSYKGPFYGGDYHSGSHVKMVSATTAWSFSPYIFDPDYDNYKAVKITYNAPRVLESAKYVRITIYGSRMQATYGVDKSYWYGSESWNAAGTGLQEIEVHSELNGANVAVSATATSAESGFAVDNLLDGNILNAANSWRASSTTYPQVITLYLGPTAIPVFEVQMWPINFRTPDGGITPSGADRAPGIFDIDTSVDGTTWTHKRRYQGVKAWALGTDTSVDVPAARVFEAF